MVICLERGADLHMAQLMPLPLTVSCFSKIQTGFTFLVPAHPGSPGQRAVKRVCVCVCVCVCYLLTWNNNSVHAITLLFKNRMYKHYCKQAISAKVTALENERVCVQLPASADYVTLLALAAVRHAAAAPGSRH